MTVEQLVSQTKAYIAEATAQMKKAEITGTPPSEIPGAENDKPIPEGATEADPQVTDGSMGPTSAYTEGGEPQKNEPVGELFEADEPVLNPEEKPLETADANAKTASDLANSLLEDIKSAQKAMRATKKAEIVADKEDETVTKKPMDTADADADAEDTDKGGDKATVTTDTTSGDTPPEKDDDVNSDKQASDELQLTTDLLAKLACYMLAEEEGANLAEKVLTKIAGEEAAEDTLNFLQKQAEDAEYRDSFIKGAQAAEDMINQLAEDQGAADAEALIGGEEGAGADAGELMGGEGGEGGEDDGITPEEFVQALDTMVQSGEITPEQAQEAMAATGLEDAGGGEGAEGGEGGEDIDVNQLASDISEAIDSEAITMDEAEALVKELEGDADPAVIAALQGSLGDEAAAGADEAAEGEGELPTEAEPAAPTEGTEGAEAPTEPEETSDSGDGSEGDASDDETKSASAKDLLDVIHRIKMASAKKSAVKKTAKAKAARPAKRK